MQSATSSEPAQKSDPLTAFHDGQRLAGCYLLKRRVSGTGNRVVWLATDEVLGKDVSLHFVPTAVLEDEEAIAVLRHEVKRNRQLIHPSILRVFDFVEEDDWVAVSMDAFTGQTLSELQEAKPNGIFEVAEIKPWIGSLCQTLEDAHRIKLVHGDVTPENVIVEADGRVRVANFGISVCIKHALGEIEEAGELSAHQSPQQTEGAAPTPVDDVYGVGVLIHRLVAGKPPFSGSAPRNAAPGMAARRSELGKAGGLVPQAWEKLVASCLEKSPASRPQVISELVAQLSVDQAGAGAPVAAAKAAPAEPVKSAAKSEAPAPPAPAKKAEPIAEAKPAEKTKAAAKEKASNVVEAAPSAKSARPAADAEPEVEVVPPTPSKSARPFAPLDVDTYLNAGRPRSRFPKVALAAGIVAVLSIVAFQLSKDKDEKATAGTGASDSTAGASAKAEPATPAPPKPADKNPPGTAAARDAKSPYAGQLPGLGDVKLNLDPPKKDATPAPPPVVEHRDPPVVPQVKPEPTKPAATPAPVVAANNRDTDAAKKALETAEKTAKDATKWKQDADKLVADLKGQIEDKAKSLTPLQKAADEVAADQKKRADDLRVAEQAATTAKQAAAEKARIAGDARKALTDADEALATLKGLSEDKAKAFAPIKKAADEMIAIRKRRDDDARAADDAAQRAQQVSADKSGVVEKVVKAAADGEAAGKAKLTAKEKAATELTDLQKSLEEKQRLAGEAAKAMTDAAALRDKQAAAMQQSEQTIAAEKAAAAKAAIAENERKAREAADAQRMADAQKTAEVEKAAEAERLAAEKIAAEKQKAEAARIANAKKEADAAKAEFEDKLKKLNEAMGKTGADAVKATPDPTAQPPKGSEQPAFTPDQNPLKIPGPTTDVAKLDITKPGVKPSPPGDPEPPKTATGAGPGYVNSLGMKFVAVGDILVSVWQTRVKDFEAFAKATGLKSTGWRDPGFKQGPEHPVVNVSWQEATVFCKWLTTREHKEGTLGANQEYRLPTDLEWSQAVGLGEESGRTPEARDMSVPDTYPWGTQWPPPPGAGNYTGEETGSDVAIRGYSDGYPWTSPVGSFPPNKHGLFDMGGNVWQWVMDSWNNDSRAKVLRGGSWYNGALKLSLLSSCRVHAAPDSSTDNYGFRVIIAPVSGDGVGKPSRK